MAGEWPVATLQEVCETITDGAHQSPKDSPDGLPMASVKDMARWGINVKTSRTISHKDFDNLVRNGCQPQIGDVLIAKDGATCLDTVCQFNQPDKIVLLSSVAILRPSKRLHSGYLRYYLDCADTRAMLKAGYVSGSAIPRVVLKDFRRAPIPVPPLAEQKAIAHILGTLDDKIELNRKTNETLEAMAQTLFKSWFVDFDPVRAKLDGGELTGLYSETAALFPSAFQDSILGLIPKDWRVMTIGGTCANIFSGGTPRTQVSGYWRGSIPWLSSGETRGRFIIETEKTITDEGVKNSSTRLACAGCTVIAGAGQGHTRGQTALLTFDSYINQSVVALTANSELSSDLFLFFDLARRYEEFRQLSDSHSSRGSLTTKLLAGVRCVLPPRELIAEFDKAVGPMVARITTNLRQSRTLAILRDTLLPKLLSGELKIGDVTNGYC